MNVHWHGKQTLLVLVIESACILFRQNIIFLLLWAEENLKMGEYFCLNGRSWRIFFSLPHHRLSPVWMTGYPTGAKTNFHQWQLHQLESPSLPSRPSHWALSSRVIYFVHIEIVNSGVWGALGCSACSPYGLVILQVYELLLKEILVHLDKTLFNFSLI